MTKHREKGVDPVDARMDKRIEEHGENSRNRRIAHEKIRTAPRRRIAKTIRDAILKEVKSLNGKAVAMDPDRIAQIAIDLAKEACKALGLESSGKKEAESD